MNFKIFLRLVLVLVTAFVLVAGVVAGGVALSYRILAQDDSELPEQDPDSQKQIGKAQVKKQEVLNVLLLGVDAEGYRTDVIILAQYNFDTKKVNMLNIPRDTKRSDTNFTQIPPNNKVNAAYALGKEEELFKAVNSLLGIEVDRYVLVYTAGFRSLVDAIGGVVVDIPINMTYDDPEQNLRIRLTKGKQQLLDGEKAEMFVRFRKNNDGSGYPDGDLGRIRAQQQFISAAIDRVLTVKNIFKIPKLLSIVIDNVETNFELHEMTRYVDDALTLKKDSIVMHSLPGIARTIGVTSFFIKDARQTQAMIEQHFKPGLVSKSMETEDLGKDDKQTEPEENETEQNQAANNYKPSWKNRFTKVEVLNGSNTDGLASKVSEDLKDKGFKVVKTGSFSGIRYSKTKAIDRTKKGYAKEVAKALGNVETDQDLEESSSVDVTVIVGNDLGNE